MNRIYILCACLLSLAGCATQSTPPAAAGCATWEQQANNRPPAVSVLSPDLAKVIGVRGAQTSRTGAGMAAVETSVYNCTDSDVVLQMRSRFMSNRGQSEPPSAWKNLFLPPHGEVVYAESAVSANTSRVAVDIYDANRGQNQFAPGQQYGVPMPPPEQYKNEPMR
ncbi:MAG: h16 [Paucimonas sp.]|nr:h16 [Paucimonas sp.]